MPFEKGNQAGAGRGKGMGRRRLASAIEAALDEDKPTTFKHIADELIYVAMQREDLSVKLKAIKEITDRVDGRVPMSK